MNRIQILNVDSDNTIQNELLKQLDKLFCKFCH